MLFGALGRWPYGYYTLLRVVVCAVAIFVAVQGYFWKRFWATWLFGFVAVLFNPLVPVHLSRQIWQPVDLAAGAAFVIAAIALSKSIIHESAHKGNAND